MKIFKATDIATTACRMPDTHGDYDTLVKTIKKILFQGKKVVWSQISPKKEYLGEKLFFCLTLCDHKNEWVYKRTKCVVNILEVLATKCIPIWVQGYPNFASKLVGSYSNSSPDAFFRHFLFNFGPFLVFWCEPVDVKPK